MLSAGADIYTIIERIYYQSRYKLVVARLQGITRPVEQAGEPLARATARARRADLPFRQFIA